MHTRVLGVTWVCTGGHAECPPVFHFPRRRSPLEPPASVGAQAALLETDESSPADNQVIEDVDVQELSPRNDFAGHNDVFRGGRGVARRVVVRDNEGGAVLPQRIAKNLADADEAGVEGADVHRGDGQHVVLGVEEDEAQLLLLQKGHLGHQELGRVGWGANLWPVGGRGDEKPPAQPEGGLQRATLASPIPPSDVSYAFIL
jgi:hypothetical protein